MTVSELQVKQAIEQALRSFSTGYLATNAIALFHSIGYQSDKKLDFYPRTSANFITTFDQDSKLNLKNALLNEWLSVDFLFQLTWDEIISNSQLQLPSSTNTKDSSTFFTSYLFFVIELQGSSYTLKQLDGIVREVNKLFPMPVVVLFRHGFTLSLSIIDRRFHKRDESKDAFEKVKHIKDIPFTSPTDAQIKKLFELSLVKLHQKDDFSNFDQFHEAWQKTLNGNIKFAKDPLPEDLIRIYLQEIGRIRLLKASEEIELAYKVADLLELEQVQKQLENELERTPQDTEWANAVQIPLPELRHRLQMGRKAKNQMVESNLRLVVSIAKKYQNRGLKFLDLIQEGNLGLIRATEKFDPKKGYRFSTYATWWIRRAMMRAIADQSRIIRLPVHLNETISRINNAVKILFQEKGRNPTVREIAECMEMTISKLQYINQCAQPVISLNIPVGEEDSTLGDLIEFNGETPEEQVSKAILRENLESVLDTLSPREQDVLRLRYGFDDGQEKSLREIGNLFNLSHEWIRQIEATALEKLRSRKRRTFLEETIPRQIVKVAQTKNVTCNKNRQIEVKPPEILHHINLGNNSEKSGFSTRDVPLQTVNLMASSHSQQTADLEGKNRTQAEVLSFDLSENNQNQANRQEAKQTLAELKETDLNGVATKPMQQNSADLHQQVTSLENTFSQLVPKLSKALQELQDLGKPLSAELILELGNSRNQFNALRARVFELAESLVLSSTQKEPEIDSLTGLKSLLEDAVQAEEQKEAIAQVRQQALRVLERVLAIAHRDNSNFQPLLECQEKARELQRAISESQEPDSHSDTQGLAEGNHSFAQLLTLIEQGDELDDDHSADLHDSVAESFGRTLATAAVRGRLIVQEASAPNLPSASIIKESKIPTHAQPPEPETAPSVEHSIVDKSDVAQAESEMSNGKLLPYGNSFAKRAYTPSNTKVIPDSQPVEKLIATAQTVAPLPPKIETHKDEPESESEQTEEDIQPQYQLTLNDIEQQNTASVSGDISEQHPLALHEQIWQLLYENKLSLAFHLARCLESKYPDFQPHLPSGIIRGVILGRYVRYDVGVGEIANSLRNGFTNLSNNCFLDGESEWNQAVSLLLATSALRPALLAPNTNASEILHSLRLGEGLNQLYEYCKIIANYGNHGLALDTTAIKTVRSQAAWESDMASLRQKVQDWWCQAPRLDMIYEPAKAVWSEWFKSNQLIDSLLFPVRQNDLSKLDVAKHNVERLSAETQINEEVKRTQREIGRFRGAGDAITGRTLGRIRLHVRQAVDFVRQWILLQELRPDKSNNYSQSQAQQLKQDLSSLPQDVLKELDSFDVKNSSVLVKAGISCCRTAVEDIRVLFEPNKLLPTVEPAVKYLLNAELLKISSLPMNSDWQPEDGSQDLFVKELFNLVAQPHYDWQQAFDMRSNSRDHEATERIIEYLQANSEISIDIAQLEQQRNHLIDNCRAELEIAVKETRRKLEGDVALGLLGESDRLDYAAQIESIENAIATTLRFSDKFEQLQAIGEAINTNRSKKIDEVRKKLLQEIGSEHPAYTRISRVLDRGDVLTANEYVDMVQRGQSIPEIEKNKREVFKEFFKEKYARLEDKLEQARYQNKGRELINNIRKRTNIEPLQMQQVPGAQAKQAAETLDTWFTVKGRNQQAITEKDVRQILKYLGFNTAQITINKIGNYTWIDVITEPIQDKNRCPVPAYGSEAKGHYRILCVWDRPPEEDLLNAVGDASQDSGAIVFHFGRMTAKRRRDLAHLCRKRGRKFIVIDDTLMFFLCGERGARLPVLFDCTLPFTFLEPYTPHAAGLVPPEMFYGRERERESIIDPMGSCLIYGGRQLGKTVLLRYVERNFNVQNEERIARFLDIKEVGRKQPLDDIWLILVSELEKLQILDASQRNPPNPRSLNQIKSWLEVDNQRRILLLLDEADNFLEADSKEDFPRCDVLRRLMQETNRRFKVVFAGLHNVLRTTRQANHPLAHFGKPICIGPLLNNGEMRAARALVEHPLESLGYHFESQDLITRILSQTNYYPSLIQLYCDQLLKHITNPDAATFDPQTSPPYVITSGHVEEAYQSQDLRQAIRDRFKLTLGLDKRYEVIAYSIAYGSLESAKGRVDGFSVSWIRDEILYWWKEGFRGRSSVDEIRALLEEMVGLGILRVTNEGGYFTLRTPNVALLMGTLEEIQEELLRDREVPLEYEAATFRSTLGIKNDSRRSPLTAQQESKLQSRENGVSIIFGCQAAGLGDLKIFLESAYVKKKEFFRYWDEISDQTDFTRCLQESSRNRKEDGTTLIVVSCQCNWSETWVNEAIQKVTRLKKEDSFMRVVFIADPQKAWQLVSQNSNGLGWLEEQAIPLKTWHDCALRHWLEDSNFPSDQKIREKITAVTGNWSTLLQDFYRLSQSEPLRWEDSLRKLEERLDDPGRARELAQSMGFDSSQPQREQVLEVLAVWGEASAEDLIDIIGEGTSTNLVNQILSWAELLSLASPLGKKDDGKDYWSVDPLVRRILKAME
jgi:RNA polymerase sigma factor (RpoD-like family)